MIRKPLFHELANHADEPRVSANGGGTDHIQAELLSSQAGFFVQIVQHFHVIRDEADRNDDDVLGAARGRNLCEGSSDIRLQPRLARGATSALIDDAPVASANAGNNEPGSFAKLRFVLASGGHTLRDA